MINDFASVLEHMDRILNDKYLFKTIQGLEIILKYLEFHKDDKTVEKDVIIIKFYLLIIILFNK